MRFFHIGDCHIGYRHLGLQTRAADIMLAVQQVLSQAAIDKPDAVIFPGDVFDSRRPSGEDVLGLRQSVDNLRKAGIAVVGICGNHDNCGSSWLEVCGITPLTMHEPVSVAGIKIIGSNYLSDKHLLEAIGSAAPADVLVLHTSVAEFGYGGTTTADLIAEVKPLGVRYLALGDIHEHHLENHDGITLCYPGSVERCAVDEPAVKFFVDVTLRATGPAVATAREITTRPFKRCVVADELSLAALLNEIRTAPHAFYLVSVSGDFVDGISRCRAVLSECGALHRLELISATATDAAGDFRLDAAPPWERSATVVDFRYYVAQQFALDSPEYAMIVNCLEQPAIVDQLAREFLTGKPSATTAIGQLV